MSQSFEAIDVQANPSDETGSKWENVVGQGLAVVAFFGTIGFVGYAAIGAVFSSGQASSASIVVVGDVLTIDGTPYKVITSKFTPKGKFKIGKKYFDPVTNVEAFPFLIEDWRRMDDRNNLKQRIEQIEKTTGKPQSVAYSIHAGSRSNGCVVLAQKDLSRIQETLEGRRIEIQ